MGHHRWNDLLLAFSVLFWCFMIQYSSSVVCHSTGRASLSLWRGRALHFLALGCPSKFCSWKFKGGVGQTELACL